MPILFTLKGELDRPLYWTGYRRNKSIDISFPEKGLTGEAAKALCSTSFITNYHEPFEHKYDGQ